MINPHQTGECIYPDLLYRHNWSNKSIERKTKLHPHEHVPSLIVFQDFSILLNLKRQPLIP